MIPPRYGYLLLILLVAGWCAACQKVKPPPPAATGFDDAIPDARSFLAGPITFDIASLENKINASLKRELVNAETLRGHKEAKYNLRVIRTGRVKLRYANKKVTFSAPLQIWLDNPLRLNKRKHAKNALCALSVDFESPLKVAPNWRLSTRARFVNYTWIKKPSVRLLGINVPITKLADNLIRKRRAEIETAIDQAVYSGLRLDRQVRPVWRDLQKPLLLTKKPDSVWLVPTPFSVAVGEVSGNSQTLTLPIRVAFYTKTVIGPRPVLPVNTQLPTIRKDPDLRQFSEIRVISLIPYSDINRLLEKELNGQKLVLAGGWLKLKKVTAYGGQHALIIKAVVGGGINGTLYFRGQPVYDTLAHTLKVKNIDFDVETEERLLATADWLLHDRLKDTLSRVLHVPLRNQILRLPMLIDRAFEAGKAGHKNDLTIRSFRFVPQRIAIRPEGIQLLLKVESMLAFDVKKL